MKARLDAYKVAPELLEAMRTLDRTVQENGALEHSLIELVKIRASQINGCAYCVHMHTADARAAGESEQRLYLLSAWRESSLYSAREKAALAWTEALTLLADTHAPDDVFEAMAKEFSPAEQVALTMLIVTINGWNRIAVGFRSVHPNEIARVA
ncbi:MAG TPA: carboxymuconolactone decarboxylase family protein [Gammaproteobacteria bacterium]|nr:carboxymuconolactone decarboxylase family protein [Gammaproteobacteria bacterium]